MSFQKYWYVFCDSKKSEYCHKEYFTFWGQKDLVDYARKEGWRIGKDKHICPPCKETE